MENTYARAPLKVTLYSPLARSPGSTYVFLGAAPAAVAAAARRGPVWPPKDTETLRKYYGSRWRSLLAPQLRGLDAGGADAEEIRGGQRGLPGRDGLPQEFGNLEDFDDPEAFRGTPAPPGEGPPLPAEGARDLRGPRQTVYSNLGAFPEDSFADLKLKIYAASRIPPYAQHLAYFGDRGASTTYRISAEGGHVVPDIRYLADAPQTVAGIPVDRSLEAGKVRVEALDPFMTLRDVKQVFVADIREILQTHGQQLAEAVRDRYQFDLLYFGFALKFWPQLSPDAFSLAVQFPASLPEVYPLLEPSLDKTRARLEKEGKLIDNTYAQAVKTQERWRKALRAVAVTQASVLVEPSAPTRVNIRNVLDCIGTSPRVPVIIGRFPAAAGEGREQVNVIKRHLSSFLPDAASALQAFAEKSLRRVSAGFALSRPKAASGPERFVFLTLQEDGRYRVEGAWREDDRLGFEAVLSQLTKVAQGLIQEINDLGAAAFPLVGRLETPAQAASAARTRATLGSITASVFWPHALTVGGFREMKNRWREYEKAGIAGVKGLQQGNAFSFLFRKGIADYDPRAFDRSFTAAEEPPANQYAHLTDPALAQRWETIYGGRTVRIFHRTTDLRVEVADVSREEFDRVRLYVSVFLNGLVAGPARLTHGIVRPGVPRDDRSENRLQALQERDPELYDLRKHDEGAKVYSVLCQHPRPPAIFSEEEAKALPVATRKRLVRYWNFTEDRPAFYLCPDKRFPHLSLRAGEHPRGYGIPCCQKTPATPGSRREAINEILLRKHIFTEEDEIALSEARGEDTASRHVLSYGKQIPPGRVSAIPPSIREGLLYDSFPEGQEARLVGVRQSFPSVPDAGFLFALAFVVDRPPEEFAKALAETVQTSPDLVSIGLGAAAPAFATPQDLAEAILGAAQDDGFSPFGPGGEAEDLWEEIVAELCRLRFGVFTAVFQDLTGGDDVVFKAPPSTTAALRAVAKGEGRELEFALVFRTPTGVYPMAAALRGAGQGRQYRRRFPAKSEVVIIVSGMAKTGRRELPDLELVLDFARARGYQVEEKLLNRRNWCYAVLLRTPSGEEVYLPVVYSPHLPDGLPSTYDLRQRGVPLPAGALEATLKDLGSFAGRRLAPLRIVAPLEHAGKAVGFLGESPSAEGLYFYHDPEPLPPGGRAIRLPHHPWEVDAEIAKSPPGLATRPSDQLRQRATAALYRNYLYRLFVAEFAALLRRDRNARLRQKLQGLIQATRFSQPESLAGFNEELRVLLRDYPGDFAVFQKAVARAYEQSGQIGHVVREALDGTVFEFDRVTLAQLRTLPTDEVKRRLDGLISPLVEKVTEAPAELQNIYVACSSPTTVDRPQCRGGKLQVPVVDYDSLLEILAADVLNPAKVTTLATMTAGVVSPLRFQRHPGERLEFTRATT